MIPLGNSVDESGKTYGQLQVLEYCGRSKGKAKHAMFRCLCSCGKVTEVTGTNLRSGHTTSCGHDVIKNMQEGLKKYNETHIPDELNDKRFGRLLVKDFSKYVEIGTQGFRVSAWNCICDCGNSVVKPRPYLNEESSCGCLWREKISAARKSHGMSKTPTYKTWIKMHERCYLESYAEKEYYQDHEIGVCDRWKSFENFLEDMGERPDGMTLDRIDFTKDYSKENCRWATPSLQAWNRRKGRNNTSGRVGVFLQKNGLYRSSIGVNGEVIKICSNVSFEEACEKRSEAELKYYGYTKDNY